MRSKAKWTCCMVAILGLVVAADARAAAVLSLDDDFTGSAGSLPDAGTWTGILNYTENGSSYITHASGVNGMLESISTFGAAGSPAITAEFLGVRIGTLPNSADNYWGLWNDPAGGGWNPTGVAFVMRTDGFNAIHQVLVDSTRLAVPTPFTLTLGTLYDFRIVWTPGTEVSFYAKAKADTAWTLLRSVSGSGAWGSVPTNALPARVRDETIDMDIDRITVVPEPATMAILALGGAGMLIRRRRQA